MMKKHNKILALMCNTELMGIWRSNQVSVIYKYIFSVEEMKNSAEKRQKWKLRMCGDLFTVMFC